MKKGEDLAYMVKQSSSLLISEVELKKIEFKNENSSFRYSKDTQKNLSHCMSFNEQVQYSFGC